jgi:hypothetical protein
MADRSAILIVAASLAGPGHRGVLRDARGLPVPAHAGAVKEARQ